MENLNKLNSSGKQLVGKCQPGLCIRPFLQEKRTLCLGHFRQLENLIYDSKSGIPQEEGCHLFPSLTCLE